MSRWTSVQFRDLYLTESRNGLSRPKRVRGSGFKMVNMGEIFAYERISNPEMDRVPMDDSEVERFSLYPGDLLFARQSLVLEGAGKCSVVISVPETTTFESHLIRVRLDPAKADSRFYFYYFKSPPGKANISSIAMQVAAAGIRGSELATLKVPFPTLAIQNQIADTLSTYDDLIENNSRRIKILKSAAETIFKAARSHSGQSWKVVPINDLYIGLDDGPHATPKPSKSGPIFLGIQNITEKGELNLSSIRHIADDDFDNWTRRVLPSPGDIVFSYEATLHRYGMIRNGFRGCLGRRIALIRPDLNRVDPYFLLYSLLDQEWRKEVTSNIISGATVDRVPLIRFPRFQLRVPPLCIQQKIGHSIRACEELAENCSRRNQVLSKTRDLLLPKLISGEIDVEHFESKAVAQGV